MSEATGDMTSAVEAAFAASSTPEPASTTSVDLPAPSTTETVTPDVSAASTTTQAAEPGPIPYPRFKEVNDKAGQYAKELEALGWAKGIDPTHAQQAIQLLKRAQANPLAFTEELESLRDHPTIGPQLRSWAARTLGTRTASRPTESVVDETMPDPDLVFEDGRKSYSADQMLKVIQFAQKQWESKIDEKVAPLAHKSAATEQYVADQVYASIKTKAGADAKSEIETLQQQYPQFEAHKTAIADVMEANPTFTLKQAWAQVFIDKVGPELAGQHAASVTKKVSAGSGSANPARPSGASSTIPSGFKEHLEQLIGH